MTWSVSHSPVLRRALMIAVVLCSSLAARAEDPLNLLFFGNSFSMQDDVPNYVGRIAVADGHIQPLIVADLSPGTDLDYHIGQVQNNPQNNVAHAAISGKSYDYAVIQGYSTEATHIQTPASDFIPDAATLSNLIRSHTAGTDTSIVLYQTWARQTDHSYYPGTFDNPQAMQAEIRSNYQLARDAIDSTAGQPITTIAPVGDAFENGSFDSSLYDSDDYHASTPGSRLASLVLYRTIYDETVSDIPYSAVSSWANLSEAQWQTLTSLADSVEIQQTPEPASISIMLGAGLLLLGRRKRKKACNR